MGWTEGVGGGKPVAGMAKMQARGQFTVPEAVRRATGAEPGSSLLVRQTGEDRFEVVVVPRHTARDFFQAMALRNDVTFEQLREGVAERIGLRAMPAGTQDAARETAGPVDEKI